MIPRPQIEDPQWPAWRKAEEGHARRHVDEQTDQEVALLTLGAASTSIPPGVSNRGAMMSSGTGSRHRAVPSVKPKSGHAARRLLRAGPWRSCSRQRRCASEARRSSGQLGRAAASTGRSPPRRRRGSCGLMSYADVVADRGAAPGSGSIVRSAFADRRRQDIGDRRFEPQRGLADPTPASGGMSATASAKSRRWTSTCGLWRRMLTSRSNPPL